MRNLLITLATAAAILAGFLAIRGVVPGETPPETPITPASKAAKEPERVEPPSTAAAGVPVTGLPELEMLHRRHGKVGVAMRDFLAATRGEDWNLVDRMRMQELIHAIRNNVTEEDIPYLLDLFNRTKDAAFRWWFSWLVLQVPDERFIDAMTDVYRLDAHRGLDALSAINKPAAMDRYLRLFENETDPAVRQHAVVALAHSDWEGREDAVTAIAKDPARASAERLEALTALGRIGLTADSLAFLMDVALGGALPAKGLEGALAASHAVPDLRSGAILAVMQRGDQEAARRLMEAADAPGADADLGRMVDIHVGAFMGPDLSEIIYDRARRRGQLSAGEVTHLIRDLDRLDRARLRDFLPLISDPKAKTLVQTILDAR